MANETMAGSIFDEVMGEVNATPTTATEEKPAKAAEAESAPATNGNESEGPWPTKTFASLEQAAKAGWVPVKSFAFDYLTKPVIEAKMAKGESWSSTDVTDHVTVIATARNKKFDFPIVTAVDTNGNKLGTLVHAEQGVTAWANRPETGTSGPAALDPAKVMYRYGDRYTRAKELAELLKKSEGQLKRIDKSPAEALEHYEQVKEDAEAAKAIDDDPDDE